MWRKFSSGLNSPLLSLPLLLVACSPPVSQEPPLITLPEMGRLSGFTLTDHTGNAFTSERLRGHIWVLDFIYTTCQAACPRMSREMLVIQQALAGDDSVRLVSISVDPEHDTPQVLTAYASRYKADPHRWYFLTGERDLVRKLQREASVDMDPEEVERSHNKCFILLDADGFIRGAYKSDDPPETDQLLADLAKLKRNPGRPTPADQPI